MGKKERNDNPELACARVEVAPDGTGTAYLVSKTWAVTCAHLVDNVGIGGEVRLFFPTAPGENVHWIERQATLVDSDSDFDCATLKLTEPLTSVTPLRLGNGCSLDDTWWSFGYPCERGEYGVPCDGRVLLPEGRSRLGKPAIHLYSDNVAAGQGAVIAGASGSPILIAGRVIGHISRVSLGRQEEAAELEYLVKVIDDWVEDAKVKKKARAGLNNVRRSRHPDRAEGGYVFAVPIRFVRGMLPKEVLTRERESRAIVTFLRSCPLFTRCSKGQLMELADKMAQALERHPAGTDVFRQWEGSDKLYFIRHGTAEVLVADATGQRHVATLGRGKFFGEAPLPGGEPRRVTVRAATELHLYVLGKDDFKSVISGQRGIRR